MPGYNNPNGNGGSNGAVRMDVNTNSYDLYNNSTRLIVSLFNTNLSLGIVAATKDAEGKLRYPTNNAIRVILTPERIQAMALSIANEFIPAMKAGQPLERSFVLNAQMTSLIQLVLDPSGNVTIYFCTEITDRIPKNVASYTFATTPSMENYDRTTGEYTQGPTFPSQFYLFARTLEDFTYALSRSNPHMSRITTNSWQRRLMDAIYEIAAKLGLNIRPTSNGNGRTYSYGGNGGNNFSFNGGNASSSAPQEQNITSLDAMASDLPF